MLESVAADYQVKYSLNVIQNSLVISFLTQSEGISNLSSAGKGSYSNWINQHTIVKIVNVNVPRAVLNLEDN